MMGNRNITLTAQQILDLNIYTFDLIDYDHDKFLEFYKLGDSNVHDLIDGYDEIAKIII